MVQQARRVHLCSNEANAAVFSDLEGTGAQREFNSLFLFVTSRCNSLCRTCFYFDKLNSLDNLTTAQIERISATAPPFRKLWLSGGEPFLRENLADIVAMFVSRNGVRNINLPTNGLLPDKIFRAVDRMLELCPGVAIDLNFSLDGLANTHDAIRGVPITLCARWPPWKKPSAAMPASAGYGATC